MLGTSLCELHGVYMHQPQIKIKKPANNLGRSQPPVMKTWRGTVLDYDTPLHTENSVLAPNYLFYATHGTLGRGKDKEEAVIATV